LLLLLVLFLMFLLLVTWATKMSSQGARQLPNKPTIAVDKCESWHNGWKVMGEKGWNQKKAGKAACEEKEAKPIRILKDVMEPRGNGIGISLWITYKHHSCSRWRLQNLHDIFKRLKVCNMFSCMSYGEFTLIAEMYLLSLR